MCPLSWVLDRLDPAVGRQAVFASFISEHLAWEKQQQDIWLHLNIFRLFVFPVTLWALCSGSFLWSPSIEKKKILEWISEEWKACPTLEFTQKAPIVNKSSFTSTVQRRSVQNPFTNIKSSLNHNETLVVGHFESKELRHVNFNLKTNLFPLSLPVRQLTNQSRACQIHCPSVLETSCSSLAMLQ